MKRLIVAFYGLNDRLLDVKNELVITKSYYIPIFGIYFALIFAFCTVRSY